MTTLSGTLTHSFLWVLELGQEGKWCALNCGRLKTAWVCTSGSLAMEAGQLTESGQSCNSGWQV